MIEILKPGYFYKLPERRKEGNTIVETGQKIIITFLETNLEGETVIEGVFTEDVLAALINRQKVLNERVPSREGSIVLTKLEEAVHWLGHRQNDRKERGVHMTHKE